METLGDNEFQSHACPPIHYTCNETLEQFSCCDMAVRIPTHTMHFVLASTHQKSAGGDASTCLISDSNLNSDSSFIIPIMRQWSGPAVVVWVVWSKCSQIMV
eukprot:scaffold23819_cov43-Cyclotella_meneghiniana.AAC.1